MMAWQRPPQMPDNKHSTILTVPAQYKHEMYELVRSKTQKLYSAGDLNFYFEFPGGFATKFFVVAEPPGDSYLDRAKFLKFQVFESWQNPNPPVEIPRVEISRCLHHL